jgi:hypothetical protein
MPANANSEPTIETGVDHGLANPLDSESLLAEVRYWDRLIDRERGRSKVQVLAQFEEHRAWALVRLFNLLGRDKVRFQ